MSRYYIIRRLRFKDYDSIITSKEPDDSYKEIFAENDVELLW